MSGGLQGALVFSSVLVQKNLHEGDCIAHVFFFSPFHDYGQENFYRENSAMWQG